LADFNVEADAQESLFATRPAIDARVQESSPAQSRGSTEAGRFHIAQHASNLVTDSQSHQYTLDEPRNS